MAANKCTCRAGDSNGELAATTRSHPLIQILPHKPPQPPLALTEGIGGVDSLPEPSVSLCGGSGRPGGLLHPRL